MKIQNKKIAISAAIILAVILIVIYWDKVKNTGRKAISGATALNIFSRPAAPEIQGQAGEEPINRNRELSMDIMTDYSAEVMQLQKWFNEMGYEPAVKEDGYFGPITRKALMFISQEYEGENRESTTLYQFQSKVFNVWKSQQQAAG